MTNILALDLGTTTGWAACVNKSIRHGTISLKQSRFEGAGMRYLRLHSWLDGILETAEILGPGIDLVIVEEVRRHLGTDAAHVYGGMLATVQSWCEANEVPYAGMPVKTIKRLVAGRGNAGKKEIIQSVGNLGYTVTDHNEADAIALLLAYNEQNRYTTLR